MNNYENNGGDAAIVLTILFFATAIFGALVYGIPHVACGLLALGKELIR